MRGFQDSEAHCNGPNYPTWLVAHGTDLDNITWEIWRSAVQPINKFMKLHPGFIPLDMIRNSQLAKQISMQRIQDAWALQPEYNNLRKRRNKCTEI